MLKQKVIFGHYTCDDFTQTYLKINNAVIKLVFGSHIFGSGASRIAYYHLSYTYLLYIVYNSDKKGLVMILLKLLQIKTAIVTKTAHKSLLNEAGIRYNCLYNDEAPTCLVITFKQGHKS